MARKLRVEYPGAISHVLNRGGAARADFPGGHGSRTVSDDAGGGVRQDGLAGAGLVSYGESFQLVVEPPQGNQVAGMK